MSSLNAADSNDLIATIYDSVTAPGGFQRFIDNVVRIFQLKSISLIIRHVETNELKGLWLSGIPKEWLESYALTYAAEDLLAHHIAHSPIAHFYASNLDITHPENFMETRFFKEWIIPQGIAYAAGAVVLQEGGWLTQLIMQRAPHHVPFSRVELDQLNLLLPHLQRAIQMRQRFADLQMGQNFLLGGLDVLTMPTFLFDESGMVAHCNCSAESLLKNQKSLLWLHNKYLRTANSDVNGLLNLEIFKAINASRGSSNELNGIILLPRAGLMPLMLMIAPLHFTDLSASQGGALMFAFDPSITPTITIDVVCSLFSLSKAEAKLSIALCEGKTLEDVARENGTSIHTVKTQLKSVFLKTGTKRQSELVSLLLVSPAYFLTLKK